MKKILGYIAVFFVYSWITTANAGPIAASITNSNGVLTINGFADGNPSTIDFGFDFNSGASGTVDVLLPITIGALYHVVVGGNITGLGSFSADFNIVSQNNTSAPFTASVDTVFSNLIGAFFSGNGNPLGTLVVNGNSLNLLSALVGGTSGNPNLLLSTQEPIPQTTLQVFLQNLDNNGNGSLTGNFTDAHLEVTQVPEPTVLLLLCTGLLGILSFSTKRA